MATEDEARAQACKFVDDNCHGGPSLAFDAKSFRALLAIELRAAERRGAARMRDAAVDAVGGFLDDCTCHRRVQALPLPGDDDGK